MSEAQVAIVTGAAGGIGEAICRRFGQAGVRVVATGRSADKLAKLKAELAPSMEISTIAVDVTAEDAPKRIVDHALSTYGRLDHLVNNAGAGVWGLVHETTDAMLDEVLNTSLRAPFRLCREALPHLKQGSSIVFVGAHPSDLMRFVSSRIFGESPTQPRSPPAYSRTGATPIVFMMTAMLSLTSIQSSWPRLKTLIGSRARSTATSIAATQSPTWR